MALIAVAIIGRKKQEQIDRAESDRRNENGLFGFGIHRENLEARRMSVRLTTSLMIIPMTSVMTPKAKCGTLLPRTEAIAAVMTAGFVSP
ncbi:hypothetical protein D3C87_2060010 [compost metagenome]